MGVFNGFGAWINQNIQQPLKAESKSSENVKSKPVSEINTHEEKDEMKEQLKLWRAAEKQKPWYDAPPKVKVKTEKGICHMHMEFTLGLPPKAAYDVLTNPDNQPYSRIVNERELLDNKKKKIVTNDGTRVLVEVEKDIVWNIRSWSRPIPISLFIEENEKDLSVVYMKDKMTFMKVFDGSYKMEPIYVDSESLCKQRLPKSREEYRKCSGGQGKIASKVTMDQYFQPSSLLNLPPLSWNIRGITIKTTKDLIEDFQYKGISIRGT